MVQLKYKKVFKKKIRNKIQRNKINFGVFGLQALEKCILTSKQIEAARRVVSRATKRKCKVWIRTPVNVPITAKPREIRMGKGKGAVNQFVRFIRRGEILFELSLLKKSRARLILLTAAKKLPIKTLFVIK